MVLCQQLTAVGRSGCRGMNAARLVVKVKGRVCGNAIILFHLTMVTCAVESQENLSIATYGLVQVCECISLYLY